MLVLLATFLQPFSILSRGRVTCHSPTCILCPEMVRTKILAPIALPFSFDLLSWKRIILVLFAQFIAMRVEFCV